MDTHIPKQMKQAFWKSDMAHAVQVPRHLRAHFHNAAGKQQHIGAFRKSISPAIMKELYGHLLRVSARRAAFCHEHEDDA